QFPPEDCCWQKVLAAPIDWPSSLSRHPGWVSRFPSQRQCFSREVHSPNSPQILQLYERVQSPLAAQVLNLNHPGTSYYVECPPMPDRSAAAPQFLQTHLFQVELRAELPPLLDHYKLRQRNALASQS